MGWCDTYTPVDTRNESNFMATSTARSMLYRHGAAGALSLAILLTACGGDAVSEADRVVEPTPIAAPSGVGSDGEPLTLEVIDGGPATGLVLTDYRGFAVYGVTGETADEFICDADCATVWIPLTPRAGDVASALDATKYSLVERPDGSAQAAYDGIPLYLWTGDSKVGITGGAGVAGTWFALTEVGGHIG